MIAIRLDFPAGRYHATPWGRHVNEGVAEWPPSPYRLLRALYDVWQRKCAHIAAEDVRLILETLASAPPTFHFPQLVASHTRSYLSANERDPTAKNLVFDPFLVIDRPKPCYVCWNEAELGPGLRDALQLLLRNLNYLGRSESWVEAQLWNDAIDAPFQSFASDARQPDAETQELACAVSPAEYEGKQSWFDALTFSTADLVKQRISAPPVLRKTRYSIPKSAIVVDPPRRGERRPPAVQAVLIALDSTVLPLVTATIEVAEQIRSRLMGAHKKTMEGDETKVSALFSGKSPDGGKRLDHGHVYILPLGSKTRKVGRIDRVLILSKLRVFEEHELDAIRGVRKLWQSDRPDVQCVLTWQGVLNGPEFKSASIVESRTPFVPPRHWRKGRNPDEFLKNEVARECRNHGIDAELLAVEPSDMPEPFHLSEYRRNRKDDPVRPGHALKLTFATEVTTPFAIGYGAHFGLGQFGPLR